MKNNSFIFTFTFILVIAVSVLIGWFYPFSNKHKQDKRVDEAVATIAVVSRAPHSFRNPESRSEVRTFLNRQLDAMGGMTRQYAYDSVLTRANTYVTATNIYARFDPPHPTDSTTYLLLLAHYDSAGKLSTLAPGSYSFGAADDGYGLAVTLGIVKEALRYYPEWKQGIEVLFTDLEEERMGGMKKALSVHPELFNRVNLAMNIDARGVKGPALLFELSPGNAKLTELYQSAVHPYSYSLTAVVYRYMPNYTDFACIKEEIPGMSFAVIDNLNYYHTHLDQYDNISRRALSHYFEQIAPMAHAYLTQPQFGHPDSFRSDTDRLFFLIPPFGMIYFTRLGWLIVNLITFGLFIGLLRNFLQRTDIRIKAFLIKIIYLIGWIVGIFLTGTAVAWVASLLAGRTFHLTQTLYVPYDLPILIICLSLLLGVTLFIFKKKTKKTDRPQWSMAILSLFACIALLLLLTIEDNFFALIPLLILSATLLLPRNSYFRWIYCFSAAIILLIETAFLKQLFFALTFGSAGLLLVFGIGTGMLIAILNENK